MTEAAERELAQISIYLAKPDVGFEEVVDWDKAVTKAKFSQFDFDVGGTACRFVYFESDTPKTNPPWLDFANEQLPPEHRLVFSGKVAAQMACSGCRSTVASSSPPLGAVPARWFSARWSNATSASAPR